MESILPSQIARLVYHYLLTEGCKDVAQTFLQVSPHLQECSNIIQAGRTFCTKFYGRNLVEILDLFTNMYSLIQFQFERAGQSNFDKADDNLFEQLCQLLQLNNSFSRRNIKNTVPSQVLLNLLDSTELHEKLAEKINKVISTPEKEAAGPDVIQTIVNETEEDPWIQGLISEIISVSAECAGDDKIEKVEPGIRENTLGVQKKGNEKSKTNISTNYTKQRSRNSSGRHNNSSEGNSKDSTDIQVLQSNNNEPDNLNLVGQNTDPEYNDIKINEFHKRSNVLETAMSNCNIQCSETSNISSDINFCFVDVNAAPPSSPALLPANEEQNDNLNTIPLSNNNILVPTNDANSTLITLPTPLFESGTIFTVIQPTATSTPLQKPITAVVVSEDPSKSQKNIFTESDAIVVPVTPVSTYYRPIKSKAEQPESNAVKKAKIELLHSKSLNRGRAWRKGMKGSIRKTINVPQKRVLRKLIAKRPPIRTLKNVPQQKLINGVEIEVLPLTMSCNDLFTPTIETKNDKLPSLTEECLEENETNVDIKSDVYKNKDVIRVEDNEAHSIKEKSFLEDNNSICKIDKSKGTPGKVPKKKISLSTPRRNSHIRVLDFGTPPNKFPNRKSNTSPKRICCPNKSELMNVKRSSLFRSPTQAVKKGPEMKKIFNSPILENPIATLSPRCQNLKGDWDKVNGVQVIINSESIKKTSINKKSKRSSWDEDLRALAVGDYKDPSPPKKKISNSKRTLKKNIKTIKKCLGKEKNNVTNNEVSQGKVSVNHNSRKELRRNEDDNNTIINDVDKFLIQTPGVTSQDEKDKLTDDESLVIVDDNEEGNENYIEEFSKIKDNTVTVNIKQNLKNKDNKKLPFNDKNEINSKSIKDDFNLTEQGKHIKTPNINNSETEVIVPGLNITPDFAIPKTSSSEVLKNKPILEFPSLETPVKVHCEGLVPRTPYLDTPMLKNILDNTSILSSDLLLTPSLPPTPLNVKGSTQSNNNARTPINKKNEDEYKQIENVKIKQSNNTITELNNSNNTNLNLNQSKTGNKEVSDKKSVKKPKSKKKLIKQYLKQAKKELFGGKPSLNVDTNKKKSEKNLDLKESVYSKIYSDDSSVDQTTICKTNIHSEKKEKINILIEQNTNPLASTPSDSQKRTSMLENIDLNKKKESVCKNKKNSQNISVKDKSEVLSFSKNISVPDSIEDLIKQSQSPKKLEFSPKKSITEYNMSTTEENVLQYSTSFSNNTDNSPEFPSLCLSVGEESDDNLNECLPNSHNKTKQNEVRHFSLNTNSFSEGNILSTNESSFKQNSLRNNEAEYSIVFNEAKHNPKQLVHIEDFDNFRVDVVIDVDENNEEVYRTLSLQPLQILLDIGESFYDNSFKIASQKGIKKQSDQKINSAPNTNEKTTHLNKQHKDSKNNNLSKNRESREKPLTHWRDSSRAMEYTRTSDGKRRIKPIRIDDLEYEKRLKKKHFDTNRYKNEQCDSSNLMKHSRHSRDKSRVKSNDNYRSSHSDEYSHFCERKKSRNEGHYCKTNPNIREEYKKEEESINDIRLKDRKLITYDDFMTEDSRDKKLSPDINQTKKLKNNHDEDSPKNIQHKKRKVSSKEGSPDVPVKKFKSSSPQALLRTVDLDRFLSVVHGENSTT
uniref:Uncharacterized protein n=1 Tax=Clastoptera arizonana TaxID=38151 RepID=A0A1B6DUK9_9HEMI